MVSFLLGPGAWRCFLVVITKDIGVHIVKVICVRDSVHKRIILPSAHGFPEEILRFDKT